jgi:hypothetical protein
MRTLNMKLFFYVPKFWSELNNSVPQYSSRKQKVHYQAPLFVLKMASSAPETDFIDATIAAFTPTSMNRLAELMLQFYISPS